MQNDITAKTTWFLKNLDLQLEDFALEKDGVTVDLYFDTVDVRDALLGMLAFYTPTIGFDLTKFYSQRTLVLCLAASGWLGRFQMLLPHRNEFNSLFNINFGVGIEPDPQGRVQSFLQAVDIRIESVASMSPDAILDFVRKDVGSAKNLFKAVQCLRGNSWHTRLINWLERGLLHRRADNLEFYDIIQLEEFNALQRVFDARRPDRHVNNFSDAYALTILIVLLKQFKNGDSMFIPRFYGSTPLLREAIDAAGLESFLVYQGYRGRPSRVLRDTDYYVFKSIFRSRPEVFDRAEVRGPDLVEPTDLIKLHDQLSQILQAQEPLTEEVLDRIAVKGRPLSAVIDELYDLSFFERVWLPFAAKEDLEIAFGELRQAVRQLQSETFQDGVRRALAATQKALEENVQVYKRRASLWTKLEKASKTLRKSILKDREQISDFFRDLGLLRFAYPKSTHKRIRDVLNSFLSGVEEAERGVRKYVFGAYDIANDEKAEQIEKLSVAAAILWVSHLEDYLIDLLESVEKLPHYSLKSVYVAATFRSNRRVEQGRLALEELEVEYEQTSTLEDRAHLGVAIAYLYFHLWRSHGFSIGWRSQPDSTDQGVTQQWAILIKKAIYYAKSSYGLLGAWDMRKKAYALNQYLYYIVEGGADDLIDDMNNAAIELVSYKLQSELWQYRFDDTLARYFHRRASIAKDEAEWLETMVLAKRHAAMASEAADRDEEVQGYRSLIEVEMIAGFRKQKSTE